MDSNTPIPKVYRVSSKDKEPLYRFILESLETQGISVIRASPMDEAPFRVTFELPSGERAGIVAYAFFANSKLTKNRPSDEHRFQVKYGGKDGRLHRIWQDPYGLYTTLFCGIDPVREIFVGADPVVHDPTKFFISIEYKQSEVDRILSKGWHAWERDKRNPDEPVEVLVGGRKESFLKYIQFEHGIIGESQGHRQLLAERYPNLDEIRGYGLLVQPELPEARVHALAEEFDLRESEVFDLIVSARRLKMAVRGWVAEEHLTRLLRTVYGVRNCERSDQEGGPDVKLDFEGTPLTVECKNVLRNTDSQGRPRVDFQRTRTSKGDPASRFYAASDFNVLAACLNAVEGSWSYRFQPTFRLSEHKKWSGKLSNLVKIDGDWFLDAREALLLAAERA